MLTDLIAIKKCRPEEKNKQTAVLCFTSIDTGDRTMKTDKTKK